MLLVKLYPLLQTSDPKEVGTLLQSLLTVKDLTVAGILLAFCVYMGYKVHILEKKITSLEATNKQLWEKYVADVKSHAEDFKVEAQKFHNTVEQLKYLVVNGKINS